MGAHSAVRTGDVFVIPLEDDEVAVGQILDMRGGTELLAAVFEDACRRNEAMQCAATGKVVLLGLTLDALLHHGRWVVVGNAPPRRDIPTPTFKIALAPDEFVEEAFDGTTLRRLSPEETDDLPFRTVVAPIRIDKATRALHGIEPWEAHYDPLRFHPEGGRS